MGVIEIPDWLYEQILRAEISALSGMGFAPDEARREALLRMGRGFVARSVSDQRALDWDTNAEHRDLVEDWWSR